MRDGSRRVIAISEITGIDQESIQLQEIFRFKLADYEDQDSVGELIATGLPLNRRGKFDLRGVALPIGR